ncbi:malonate--CoA ligase [Methylocystis hirsuta]|uniref:Malonyl-CoA synthase n=1 Tax=Methylocystis hirsuta TaxID=369798 RepID=A0A3M9XKU0_9HYPH|nr:malonyl-CoA synthase [Methylocystis hirsuta]RNJ48857.1 malonyl-CoA synthase [Methylocystis hirsuta]
MTAHLYAQLAKNFSDGSKVAFEQPNGVFHTYADVEAGAARYANALISLDVEPGDRIAIQVEKSVDAVLLNLGCLRAGAVLLPLNTAYTAAEVGYFLSDAKPRIFVHDPARPELAEAAAMAKVAHVETMAANGMGSLPQRAVAAPAAFADATLGPNDPAAILYTSGTTGRSKGAVLSQENLASNARTLLEYWRFTPDDVLIHALPIYHAHGLFVAINTLLMAGGRMLFLPKFDAELILKLMPGATSLMGVPTFYTRLLAHSGLTREATAQMRLFISGSAPLLVETHRAWRERTGHVILERYGMTETGMNTSNPYDGERVAGSVGFPLPGVSVRIANPTTGQRLGGGEIGMIEVKGPNVFSGYWRMPERTKAEFRADGYFITGDLGKIDARGYVHIVGRGKDLIISGGLNVYPKEIETAIDAVPGVVESAVIGTPHPDLGEGVTAIVVREKDAAVDEMTIVAALERTLAKYKQPKRVLFVNELPRNTMGKVQKNVLRDVYGEIYKTTPQATSLELEP